MIIKNVPNTWLKETGCRLDCGPFVSGSIEAKVILNSLKNRDQLKDLVIDGGILNGPVFKRHYVRERKYGIPFLGSSDMVNASFKSLPFFSEEEANTNRLKPLILRSRTTLISCSGTIGKMAFVTNEMDGFLSSQHVMKVIGDEQRVSSGYLHAFLASKYASLLIKSGTYGAIITHIEPHHLETIPVPRFAAEDEKEIDDRVSAAAIMRAESNQLMDQAGKYISVKLSFPEDLAATHRAYNCTITSSSLLQKRMDATCHDATAQRSDELVRDSGATHTLKELGVESGESGRMKLVFTDTEYGIPFSTSGEIFRATFAPTRFLSKSKLGDVEEYGVQEQDILLARSGQVGGIIGTGVWADSRFKDTAVSVDVIRIKAQESKILPGYLYAYLMCTDVGYRQLIRTAAGSSIPHLSSDDVLNLKLPRISDQDERKIHNLIVKAGELVADAQALQDEAILMVEEAIEAAASND